MKLTEKDKNLVMRALLENCAVLADAVGEGEELDETFELLEYVKADGVEANMDDILDFCEEMWDLHGPFDEDDDSPIAQLCLKVYDLEEDVEPETNRESDEAILFDKIREKLTEGHEIAFIDPASNTLVEHGFMDDACCSVTYGLQDKVVRIRNAEGTVLFMFDKNSITPRMFKELFETLEESEPYKKAIIECVRHLEDEKKLRIIWTFAKSLAEKEKSSDRVDAREPEENAKFNN